MPIMCLAEYYEHFRDYKQDIHIYNSTKLCNFFPMSIWLISRFFNQTNTINYILCIEHSVVYSLSLLLSNILEDQAEQPEWLIDYLLG